MLYCIAATNQSDWHEFGISGDYETCYAYMGMPESSLKCNEIASLKWGNLDKINSCRQPPDAQR